MMMVARPADYGKTARWTMPALTEDEQARVEQAMQAEARRKGGVTKANVTQVVRCKTVERALAKTKVRATDAAWAWVAQQQAAGEIPQNVARKVNGGSGLAEPFWQSAAQLRAGWGNAREVGVTQDHLTVLQRMQRVREALQRYVLKQGELSNEEDSSSEEEVAAEGVLMKLQEEEVITATPEAVEAAWQSVKRKFDNKKQPFWTCVGLLMVGGQLQGSVGVGPKEGSWWELAWHIGYALGAEPVKQEVTVASTVPEGQFATEVPEVVQVGVDVMSCTQSARREMEAKGMMYVPLDKEEWVFSSLERCWVQNVVCDVMKDSPAQLLQKVKDTVEAIWGKGQRFEIKAMWVSPDCRTFSKTDASNRNKGCGFRDHRQQHRPPLQPSSTKYGRMAREADQMVMRVQQIIKEWCETFTNMVWAMENPVGSLERREYMQWDAWFQLRQLCEVHYCAYDHPYHKPTHIWTNMLKWVPKGQTGTGKCEQRCCSGEWRSNGKYRHWKGIARESHREVQGKGRKAWKNMVPQKLHAEIWSCV